MPPQKRLTAQERFALRVLVAAKRAVPVGRETRHSKGFPAPGASIARHLGERLVNRRFAYRDGDGYSASLAGHRALRDGL